MTDTTHLTDAIRDVFTSTKNFHERFNTASQPDALEARLRMVGEEFTEVVLAVGQGDHSEIAAECADFIVTVFGVYLLHPDLTPTTINATVDRMLFSYDAGNPAYNQKTLNRLAELNVAVTLDILNNNYWAGLPYLVLFAVGTIMPIVGQEKLIEGMRYVIAKNDAKTWDTHEINNKGKVARRG